MVKNTRLHLKSHLEKFYSHANDLHSVPTPTSIGFWFILSCVSLHISVHTHNVCVSICACIVLLIPPLSYRIHAKDIDRSLESGERKQF